MARFCTNENFPVQVVAELRRLGHDVVTSLDAGNANSATPDAEVLHRDYLLFYRGQELQHRNRAGGAGQYKRYIA